MSQCRASVPCLRPQLCSHPSSPHPGTALLCCEHHQHAHRCLATTKNHPRCSKGGCGPQLEAARNKRDHLFSSICWRLHARPGLATTSLHCSRNSQALSTEEHTAPPRIIPGGHLDTTELPSILVEDTATSLEHSAARRVNILNQSSNGN